MPSSLDVRYLDNHLLVVNKLPGLLSQADHTGDPDLLTLGKAYVKEQLNKPGRVFLGLVHRLDRPASGLMVLARTSKAAARLSDQFRRRTVDKRYLALVEGRCEGAGLQEDYLVKEDRQVRIVSPVVPGAQRAALQWRSLGQANKLSLVEVQLKTGRPHQIRVQLAHLGFPILGDRRYGAERELDGRNLALHAYRLSFTHPTRRAWMSWTAGPPSSWGDRFAAAIRSVLDTEGPG